ncbi:MAG: pyrroline-5-carboxylate reductase, partial [Clostridiales bacterium]|nr:pyrroline-5-carboxylate reductase [Clostridiales bacterium]
EIIANDTSRERLTWVAEKYDIKTTQSNTKVAQQADIIFLSVKPNAYDTVIRKIRSHVREDALIIILAAGLGIKEVREKFGAERKTKLVKVMPNIAAMVNCSMTAVCAADDVSEDELTQVLEIFNSIGKTEILPEHLFDAFTALAGSSPAYAFMFIEAMADAGVKHGFSRKLAIEISAQALLGATKMVLETGENPAALKDAVCSPGGTTIEAVCELERNGFRNAVISGVTAAVDKYNRMKG